MHKKDKALFKPFEDFDRDLVIDYVSLTFCALSNNCQQTWLNYENLKNTCLEEFKQINKPITLTIEKYSYDYGLVQRTYNFNTNGHTNNENYFVYFANFTKKVNKKNDQYCIGPPTMRFPVKSFYNLQTSAIQKVLYDLHLQNSVFVSRIDLKCKINLPKGFTEEDFFNEAIIIKKYCNNTHPTLKVQYLTGARGAWLAIGNRTGRKPFCRIVYKNEHCYFEAEEKVSLKRGAIILYNLLFNKVPIPNATILNHHRHLFTQELMESTILCGMVNIVESAKFDNVYFSFHKNNGCIVDLPFNMKAIGNKTLCTSCNFNFLERKQTFMCINPFKNKKLNYVEFLELFLRILTLNFNSYLFLNTKSHDLEGQCNEEINDKKLNYQTFLYKSFFLFQNGSFYKTANENLEQSSCEFTLISHFYSNEIFQIFNLTKKQRLKLKQVIKQKNQQLVKDLPKTINVYSSHSNTYTFENILNEFPQSKTFNLLTFFNSLNQYREKNNWFRIHSIESWYFFSYILQYFSTSKQKKLIIVFLQHIENLNSKKKITFYELLIQLDSSKNGQYQYIDLICEFNFYFFQYTHELFFHLKYKKKNSNYCLLLDDHITYQRRILNIQNLSSPKIKIPFKHVIDKTVLNKRKVILNDYYILF